MADLQRGDQLQTLAEVIRRLAALEIPYMLTGSLAYSYYVEPRLTRDIDLVIEVTPGVAGQLTTELGDDFYCDRASAESAAASGRLFNAIDQRRLVKIDFVVRKDDVFRREEFSRRRVVRIDHFDVWIVSPEDLLLSKLVWARESGSAVQLADVRALAARGPAMDWTYIRRWADHLEVTAAVRELKGE